MAGWDFRLLVFTVLLFIGFYAATHRNYFRFVLINFRDDVNRIPETAAGSDINSKRPCSFSVFRKYLRETRSSYLPGDGVWKRRGGRLERFHPDLCSLSYGHWIPRSRLARCFARSNVSYLVILGDSNALRLYKVIRRALSAVGTLRTFNCSVDVRQNDVVTPALPVRDCLPYYRPLSHFLPPSYFRCKLTVAGLRAERLLVQYLPVTGDLVELHRLFDRNATGCVNSNTSKVVQTQAATIQVRIL